MSELHGLVGSWRVTAAYPPGPIVSLGTFGADGTAVVAPPPVFPPMDPSGSAIFTSGGHGAWEAIGPETTVLTFVALAADAQGNPRSTVTVRAKLMLGADGQTFRGEGARTFADPAGNIMRTEPAVVHGTRIVAEPPAL